MTKRGIYPIEEFKDKWDFDSNDYRRTLGSGFINRVFLNKHKIGYTLNVCCGTDRTGDVLVDVVPSVKPTLVADLRSLPFREKFGLLIIVDI